MIRKIFAFLGIILITIMIWLYLVEPSNENKEQIVIDYLNNKYGDGEWKITSVEDYAFYTGAGLKNWYEPDGVRYVVTSKYTNDNSFHIYVNESNMVTTDCFLPTYYSIKYNLNYVFSTTQNEEDDFSELINKMVYITDYHYPYRDWKYSSSGWHFTIPQCRIDSFLMNGFYNPLSVEKSPEKKKTPDIIPDNQKIPDIKEIIYEVEQYFSSDRLKNLNINDDEFYTLIFKNGVTDNEIIEYISNHITEVDGIQIVDTYKR